MPRDSGLVWDQAEKLVQLSFKIFSESMFLIVTGRRLNILAPLTEREDSLALLTAAGALATTW